VSLEALRPDPRAAFQGISANAASRAACTGWTMEMRSNPAGPEQLLEHAAWARRLAGTLVRDAAAADDLVQQAWLAALLRPPAAGRPLRPWLGQVLRNFARQGRRATGRRAERENLAPAPTALPGPEEWIERLDSQRALTEELALLDEPLRSTVLLRYFEDLEPSEIARRQGLPAGTVRWRLKRGLDELRVRLDRRFGDRRRWALLFVPLARISTPPIGAPAPGSMATTGGAGAALTGALIMNTSLKVAGAAAAALVAYFGLALTDALPADWTPWLREAPLEVSFRPLVEVATPASAPELPAFEAARQEVHAAAAPVEVAAAEPEVSTTVTLLAGVFDEDGAALVGGTLRALEYELAPSAPSGLDGQLRLSFDLPAHEQSLSVLVERMGYASEFVHLRVTPPAEVLLGNFRLLPGGAISGRVVDAQQRGVAGALVTTGSTRASVDNLQLDRYEFYPQMAPRTTTGPDGTFLLGGVAPGFVRVWASAPGWLSSYSAPVEVRVGQESMGADLVLELFSDKYLVRGVVRGPEGAKIPWASLSGLVQSPNISKSWGMTADDQGHFKVVVPPGMRLTLSARDHDGTDDLGWATARDLVGGMTDVELRLPRLGKRTLAVRSRDGEPVERFSFSARSLSEDLPAIFERAQAEHAGGREEFSVPQGDFVLRIAAPGFALGTTPVLNPDSVGELVEVTLDPLPGLRGQVMALGEPAGSARVRLYALADPDLLMEHNDFEVEVKPVALDDASCDAEGRFMLTPRERGKFIVRAEQAGLAPTEVGPIELDPNLGFAGLRLELREGGAIEGRVVMPPGPDAAGRIVGISRGDGHACTQRAGPGGSFRFEHLTPGDWQVRVVEQEIHPGSFSTSTTTVEGDHELDFDCRVEEGRTTHFDIDFAGDALCKLSGILTINGRVPTAWNVQLMNWPIFKSSKVAMADLDVEGAFELSTPKAGPYLLLFSGPVELHGLQYLAIPVELAAGSAPWSLDLAAGSLIVENVPAQPSSGDPELLHLWPGPDGSFCMTALQPDAAGRCILPSVPAGKGRIVRFNESVPDPLAWEALATCDVIREAATTISLP
jgi:RNA polymerase sigma factor (sigma-70 family)